MATPARAGSSEIEARFNSLLEQYGKLLRNAIAAHCPKDMGLHVDDLVQDASLRLWRALSSEREIQNVASYLHRIAATVTIDAIRRIKARREEQMQLSPEQDRESAGAQEFIQHADPRPSPEAVAERQRILVLVNEILGGFPENRRRALGLHFQGFTTLEIGNLLGWREAKARNLVYRGLADLRRQLLAQGVEYEIE